MSSFKVENLPEDNIRLVILAIEGEPATSVPSADVMSADDLETLFQSEQVVDVSSKYVSGHYNHGQSAIGKMTIPALEAFSPRIKDEIEKAELTDSKDKIKEIYIEIEDCVAVDRILRCVIRKSVETGQLHKAPTIAKSVLPDYIVMRDVAAFLGNETVTSDLGRRIDHMLDITGRTSFELDQDSIRVIFAKDSKYGSNIKGRVVTALATAKRMNLLSEDYQKTLGKLEEELPCFGSEYDQACQESGC